MELSFSRVALGAVSGLLCVVSTLGQAGVAPVPIPAWGAVTSATLSGPAPNFNITTPAALAPVDEPATHTPLLQFRSHGHVLGFNQEGMLVAGSDRLLKVGFVDAAPVAPKAAGAAGAATQAEHTPSAPASGAPPFEAVSYKNLWPGIDLTYDAHGGIVRSTYTLTPGASPEAIRLSYNVAPEINESGGLTLRFATGTLTESAPIAWQDIDGHRQPVAVAFRLHPENAIGFSVGDYDPTHALVIDPTLTWNTFLGGVNFDEGNGIATDAAGNVFVTGTTFDTWLTPVRAYEGLSDAFVAKLNGATGALLWHTFLGGAADDEGRGIATDAAGNVYVTGSSDMTWGSPVLVFSGLRNAFVAKLNGTTGALGWHTFLGAGVNEEGLGIATGTAGNIFVTGTSFATWGSPVRAYSGLRDAFVAQLNGTTGALGWNTFLGGANDDFGKGIATDGAGHVYVTGQSNNTWGSPVLAHAGGNDAFVAKLNGTTGALGWHTFLGGANNDIGQGIATDGAGHVYVTGQSNDTWGSPVRAYEGLSDAFVAKLNGATGALLWHTFLGGAADDEGRGIATDGAGNVFVAGWSNATWGSPVSAHAGSLDAFVAQLDRASGVLLAHTFMGSASFDDGHGIATDAAGNVYVTGSSFATWGSPVLALEGLTDAFVAKVGVPPAAGGGDPGPEANLIINGNAASEFVTTGNPINLQFRLRDCGQGNELFLVLHAPAMGIHVFSYLTMTGQWLPLPADLSQITPFLLAPADGTYPLFAGNAPPGRYELYFVCDFVKNGHLDYQAGGIHGVFDHLVVTVP